MKCRPSHSLQMTCSVAVILFATVDLAYRRVGATASTGLFSSTSMIATNVAICLMLAGVALGALQYRRRLSTGLGIGILATGLAALANYIIVALYNHGALRLQPLPVQTGFAWFQMMPNLAGVLALLGVCLIHISSRRLTRRYIVVIAAIASIIVALGLMAVLDKLVQIPTNFGWSHFTLMHLHTAICIALLGIGIMAFLQQQHTLVLWLPVSIFIGFVTITLCLTAAVRDQANVRIKLLLQAETNHIAVKLSLQLSSVYSSLDRMRKRWDVADGTPLPLWEADAQSYVDSFPALSAVSLTNSDKVLIDTRPMEGHQALLGYKLDSDPARAMVIDRVQATGKPQTSHILRLRTGQRGFLYINQLTRDGKFDGLLIAVLEVEKLFGNVLDDDNKQNFSVSIRENGAPAFTSLPAGMKMENKWQETLVVHDLGMNWTISIVPTRKYLAGADRDSLIAFAILTVGIVTAALISLCTYLALIWRNQTKRLQKSETLNNAILANAASTIVAVDPRGGTLVFNRAAEKLTGYSADDIVGKRTPALWHDETEIAQHAAELTEEFGRMIEPGFEVFVTRPQLYGSETREWTFVGRDGQRYPVEMTVTVLRDNAGKINGYMGIGQDITLQKRQHEALKTSEETFRSAMENASIGMALVSPGGNWLKVNKALCDMLGYESDELLNLTFQKITHPEDVESNIVSLKKILSGEIESLETEKRYIHKNGHSVWSLLNVSLVRKADGSPNYMITQVLNISERKQIEQMKDEFVSVVSHELRTPLTSIRGSLGLITGALSKELPPHLLNLVSIAHKNSERLILLINDILDIDKIAAGKMRFDMKHESVAWLMQQAVDANRAYGEKFDVAIQLEPVDKSLMITVDVNRFMQILSNLLSNATKFSRPGTIVKLIVTARDNHVRISVQDRGYGIPKDFQFRIFGKFLQADSSVRREQGGTGLGLHITKEIVVHMGGTIGFESAIDQGSTFWIEFPDTSARLGYKVCPGDTRQRILICEDDGDVALVLRKQIQDAGFDTDIAYSIAAARISMLTTIYAAITLDLSFPNEDGIDFIRELRSDPATADIPIVVVSAWTEEGRQRLGGDAIGIVDWLKKPLDENQLLRALQRTTDAGHAAKPRILHVEDDRDLSNVLATVLSDRAELVNVTTLQEAKVHLQRDDFVLVILDVGLPDGNGLALLNDMQALTRNPVPVLILSAEETPADITARVSGALVKSRMSETKIVETILSLIKNSAKPDEA